MHGDLGPVEEALSQGVPANAATDEGVTPLMIAAASGHADIVTALLAKGAAVNATTKKDGITPLVLPLNVVSSRRETRRAA